MWNFVILQRVKDPLEDTFALEKKDKILEFSTFPIRYSVFSKSNYIANTSFTFANFLWFGQNFVS